MNVKHLMKSSINNKLKTINLQLGPHDNAKYQAFWKNNFYFAGKYDCRQDFEGLNQQLSKHETGKVANRIFYLALPPSVFEEVTIHIRNACVGQK